MLRRSFALLAILAMTSALGQADIVTFDFTGTVNFVTDPDGYLGAFALGDAVTGRFTYEAGALPGGTFSSPTTAGGFDYPANSIIQVITINGFSFFNDPALPGDAAGIRTLAELSPDQDGVSLYAFDSTDPVRGFGYTSQNLGFNNSRGALLDSTLALPTVDQLLLAHAIGTVVFTQQPAVPPGFVEFTVDSITVVTPEPATWICAAVGFALIALKRRR